MRISPFFMIACLLGSVAIARAGEPTFRTDGGNTKLPWFQLKAGEFPPEGSSHHIGGELIALDHLNRTGTIRIDRDDTQRRSEWDRTLSFTMLPYGSISYLGARAELRDIPIGTHLHGQFYVKEKPGKVSEGPFQNVLRLEDDFSFFTRQGRTWRVDAINTEKGTITLTGVGPGKDQSDAKASEFEIGLWTRIWKGRGLGEIADITVGQRVLVNLTVCTLKGPGRCTEIWLDLESRTLATARQREIHLRYQRDHGLAGWIESVDNQERLVTVTLFDLFDPAMLENYTVNEGASTAVAESSLRTYDQISDAMRGTVVSIEKSPPSPGNSGVKMTVKPNTLLEGFRPKRYVRIFSGKWKVDDLPKEERLYD